MKPSRVVIIGGGLAGMATANAFLESGIREVNLVEREPRLGGLAGSFERAGRFYPLGYHHILHRDRTLRRFLERIGVWNRVRWRRVRMLVEHTDRLFDLGSLAGFARFPLAWSHKLRFLRLMLRSSAKSDWSEWVGRSAAELLDSWSSRAVREALFEPMTQLKFRMGCADLSAAWVGARLHHREGSAPLGYIPGANWTTVLCDGLTQLLERMGCRLRTGCGVKALHAANGVIRAAVLDDGSVLEADVFVAAIPARAYLKLVEDRTPGMAQIRYTSLVSVVCATRQRVDADFYWLNLSSLRRANCAIFQLSNLNPTIGAPGEACFNFVTHLGSEQRELLARSDAEILNACAGDFAAVFGRPLDPIWTHISRIDPYSPVFTRDYQNPPVRSHSHGNLYFAGVHRTFPSVASTGCALQSGLETAQAALAGFADLQQPGSASVSGASR